MKTFCPQCGKSFLIQDTSLRSLDTTMGEAGGSRKGRSSVIICTDCQWEFTPVGMHAETLESKTSTPDLDRNFCPHCEHSITSWISECAHCQRIPMKVARAIRMKEQESLSRDGALLTQLQEQWLKVLDHFDDVESHRRFLSLCFELKHLDFAESRYQHLRSVLGDDEDVNKQLQQIEVAKLKISQGKFGKNGNFGDDGNELSLPKAALSVPQRLWLEQWILGSVGLLIVIFSAALKFHWAFVVAGLVILGISWFHRSA